MNLVPFVVTKFEAASVLAEPVVTPSVLAEAGDLTPSVLVPLGLTDSVTPAGAGAGAEEAMPAWNLIESHQGHQMQVLYQAAPTITCSTFQRAPGRLVSQCPQDVWKRFSLQLKQLAYPDNDYTARAPMSSLKACMYSWHKAP